MQTFPVRRPYPSMYEQTALEEIARWREPKTGWLHNTLSTVNNTWQDISDLIRKLPGVEWTIDNVIKGLLELTNEITQDSVWTEAIYNEYKSAGHPIHTPRDIRTLDLEDVDAVMAGLKPKYQALAAVEGATTGYAGAAGIAADIIALVALNLRAAGEYAAYCGFDITQPTERLFALRLLDVVSAAGQKADDIAVSRVISVPSRVAQQQSLQALEQLGLSQALEKATKVLGTRLLRIKLTQIVPITGALIGGGYNTYYTSKVCDAAFNLYRERFLFEKYGPDALGL